MMMLSSPRNSVHLRFYIDLLISRKWFILSVLMLGIFSSFLYINFSTPLYRSSTLILVEPQRIPTAYVSPTVTSTVQERLNTISQQILSRTNLEKIINQFALYGNIPERDGVNGLASGLSNYLPQSLQFGPQWLFRRDLLISDKNPPLEGIVERLRKAIEVKVIGGNNAFSVSYTGTDPLIVMNVTNTLASFFIEENLRIREQQAQGTSDFLEAEHGEARKELEKLERALNFFKEQHMGSLPEQLNANLRTLDRLQADLQVINDAIKSTEDRKILYEVELRELENKIARTTVRSSSEGDALQVTDKLEKLRDNLARLQAEFNENYPDILILRNQIRLIEKEDQESFIAKDLDRRLAVTALTSDSQSDISLLSEPIQNVKAQLRIINTDITTLRGRHKRTTISIKEYEKRVEDTFTNEQKLLNLTRDYEMSQKHYQELLQKRLAARISENLEKRQKAEQFRIVDPAKIPERPYKPERGKIIALGSLLSVGLAGTYIFMNEYLRPSYRKPEDFEGSTNLPILASIPSIRISESEDCGLVTVCDPESMESEQYRLLYTRICQVNAIDSKAVLAVSSSIKGEGKTLTALNLSIVIARDFGKKTLLLEGDLKNPKILKYLHKTTESGLFEVLSERVDLQSGLIRFTHDNLSVLAAPRDVKSSAMLLNSNEMKDLMVVLKERYEVIIVDTPPALLLPDIHIIKGLVDGIILVVRAGKTPKEAVEKSIEVLGKEKMIGIVLNDQKKPIGKYYRYSYAGSGE